MSEEVVVRCPSCSQKYRVPRASVGHHGRCKKCQTRFRIVDQADIDEDTVCAWITNENPSSASVMGSTGIFHGSPEPQNMDSSEPARAAEGAAHGPMVKLIRVDSEGAHFEFPTAALAGETLRNAFPRKCVGCGTRSDLIVHLVYWRDRMSPHEALTWQARQDSPAGKLVAFSHANEPALLKQLPAARGLPLPFSLPFPLFSCEFCRPSREVRGRVASHEGREVCRLAITSLSIAVDFFRDNGGRHTVEYHRLIEERDQHVDAWRGLDGRIRHRIAQWFSPVEGEQFVGFFRDAEFAPLEAGASGMVLTNRRLIFKKYAACREYPLHTSGRIEIIPKGGQTTVHIYERGERPAVLRLEPTAAEDLAGNLRRLHCRWTVVSQ